MQKTRGHFILKMFDVLTETSVHLLYLLFLFYDEVYIYKPKTSRPTNSEKYVICKYFKDDETNKVMMLNKLKDLSFEISKANSKFVSFKLFRSIPQEFVDTIFLINNALLDKQCLHLESAIEYCNDTKFLEDYEGRLDESLERRREVFRLWEETYNLNSYV
jgi:cap1 methyltransferase